MPDFGALFGAGKQPDIPWKWEAPARVAQAPKQAPKQSRAYIGSHQSICDDERLILYSIETFQAAPMAPKVQSVRR